MIYTALLDANVLYPAPLRDLLLQLAVSDIFKAKWTAGIHLEWIEALLRHEPHRDRAALERTRDLMDSKTRDSLVTGYEALIPSLELPDPNDRHVLAAAIVGRCDVIVTQNLKTLSGAGPCALRHRCPTPGRISLQPSQPGPGPFLWRRAEGSPAT